MNLDLKNKTAVVCGSTQGIGKAVAIELALLGANIVLIARNEEKLLQVKSDLPTIESQKHQYLVVDFNNTEELKNQLSVFLDKKETPEILVNNTGGPSPGAIIEEDYSKFEATLSAHLQCNHILVQALVPGMKSKGYGRIINIISTSVYMPIPGLGVSNTTRGAVASWAKTLSLELGQYGITVNNVLPGLTETGRLESLIQSKMKETGVTREEMEVTMNATTPAARFGSAEEVASVAAFLATPTAAYVNGVSIPVDGGRTGCI